MKKQHNLHAVQGPLDPPLILMIAKKKEAKSTINVDHLGQQTSNKGIIATSPLTVPALQLLV